MPSNIDTAVDTYAAESGGNVVYFFKGDYYWAFDTRKGRGKFGGPIRISDAWPGMPSNIDTAVDTYAAESKEDVVYFFNQGTFSGFDTRP